MLCSCVLCKNQPARSTVSLKTFAQVRSRPDLSLRVRFSRFHAASTTRFCRCPSMPRRARDEGSPGVSGAAAGGHNAAKASFALAALDDAAREPSASLARILM